MKILVRIIKVIKNIGIERAKLQHSSKDSFFTMMSATNTMHN